MVKRDIKAAQSNKNKVVVSDDRPRKLEDITEKYTIKKNH